MCIEVACFDVTWRNVTSKWSVCSPGVCGKLPFWTNQRIDRAKLSGPCSKANGCKMGQELRWRHSLDWPDTLSRLRLASTIFHAQHYVRQVFVFNCQKHCMRGWSWLVACSKPGPAPHEKCKLAREDRQAKKSSTRSFFLFDSLSSETFLDYRAFVRTQLRTRIH